MLACGASQGDDFRIFVFAHRTTGDDMHGDLLPKNNRCFISPSDSWKTVTVCSLAPSHSVINAYKCFLRSSMRISALRTLCACGTYVRASPIVSFVCSATMPGKSGCEAFDQNVAVE